MEEMLVDAPELEARALFEWLCEQRSGRYQEGQLRTFQRRVAEWRALNVEQVAILAQVHRPGEVMQTDGVWLTELEVTIGGELFRHLLMHSVLCYSNWEWGRVVQSESLIALRLGLQSTLIRLGHAPEYHQTDNSSAATRLLRREEQQQREAKEQRGYTEGYLQLLEYYGMEPRTTHVNSPHEDGDVESLHGGLKRSMEQHLLLRGNRNFGSVDEYEGFLVHIMDKRNRRRQARLAEELAVMKPLSKTPLDVHFESF
jgi:hypothetical protein